MERRHADAWVERLAAAGVVPPPFHPSWRTRALIWLARRFGTNTVLPSVATLEEIDSHTYHQQSAAEGRDDVESDPAVAAMAAQERSHARVLRHIAEGTSGGLEGGLLARIEGRHRAAGGNALRAAVLGANDGLVSNLSLVMGVAGASLAGNAVLVTGLAGLLAGAGSMALGEWLSVQSSRELYEKQLRTEAAEIEAVPEEEAQELALIYQARGLDEAQAQQLAARILGDRHAALDTLAREELGIDPGSLGGSAWEAAATSFALFALGAIVPVLPFMLLGGMRAVVVSIFLSTVGLFAIGAGITLFTGRRVLFSGARQVLFGLAAAALTFGLGRLLGANLSG
jgi:VIT1/CCC1 family predicted Fe2+/Mn2+ transporter